MDMTKDLLAIAIRIAAEAHEGQVDKAGMPYILHPLHLMAQFKDIEDKIVAVLHDTMEDAKFDVFTRMQEEGFPYRMIMNVVWLSHKRGEPYEKYIEEISKHPLARRIKLADLKHNMDIARIPPPITDKDLKRLAKYAKAYNLLLWVLTP
jgi:GTP diphosphokinase / guanosine-3',5'-bis(diphosphate) 3'-diphosphatase